MLPAQQDAFGQVFAGKAQSPGAPRRGERGRVQDRFKGHLFVG